jgi:hemerythrin-like domain-containing protein
MGGCDDLHDRGSRQEHCNIESLLRVLEQELSVFERGDRPDYNVILAVINYFKDYPDSCHHPKEDLIVEKLKARDPLKAATIGDLEAEHREVPMWHGPDSHAGALHETQEGSRLSVNVRGSNA